jgi:ribonuclease-3
MKASNPSALRRGLSVMGKLLGGTRKGPSGERVRQLKKLERRIGLRFTDLGLLEQALTHRSYSHVTSQTRNESNERMEFLGDSVLGLSVSQFLYLQFPDRSEGALSKMKSLLVSRKVLSTVARDAGLGEFLLLSGEESEMGGRDRASILADSFEGVIGAVYLDQGFRAANKFIQRFLLGSIHEILKDEGHTNFKSLLQEYVQSRRLSHPVYRVRREEGPEHEKEFAIEVVVKGEVWGVGRGKSKKDAEQNAARAALERRQGREVAPRRRSAPEEAPPRVRSASPARAPERPRASAEPRERRERRDAEPRDRGDHGILASRERLRSVRREEAEQRRREESEFRERREEPRGPADAARPADGRRRGGRGAPSRGSRPAAEAAAPAAETGPRPTSPETTSPAEPRAVHPGADDAVPAPAARREPDAGAGDAPPDRSSSERRPFGRRRRARRAPGEPPVRATAPPAAADEPPHLPEAPAPAVARVQVEVPTPPDVAPEPAPERAGGPPSRFDEPEPPLGDDEAARIAAGFARRKRRHVRGLRKR